MRRQAAHGVKGHWAGLRGGVNFAPGIGPGDGQLERLLECRVTHLMRKLHDTRSINACDGGCPLGRAGRHAVAQQLEGWRDLGAVGQFAIAF